ncbi:MAG: bifunctional diaminohydroxyphosphoribosylaminopyrimidine deaminase/5-amino-6-(5-phosphoribosylamino)uracil reductase RibD [Legionellaceae bacterium]|jgi:diaminohydroxyphosphoribosylaminopyrimidine deaminase/5-amino-6-(5-phosphoribosylamino)uracil reductase|nr:bifunctional diaminohydroxyphosphoribosylaminopyrimidine deaminase/5-amino-6-(5-phosphoribosylamino)uracil reductase RibD [Legionellaceae bacterium]
MHEQFLLAALRQARLRRGQTAPNPSVGAVAVRAGTIIAQAFHPGVGQPHAEQVLVQMLPEDCSDITVYVTLEPCNHWGRTQPCVDVLIARRVKQVVYAYADPNPTVVKNNTPKLLKAHGIAVLHYPMPVINQFYESYTFWFKTGRPWVTVKMAQTLDGKIAGAEGARVQISNAICAKFTHQERLHTDVILTTAATIQADNPLLNARVGDEVVAKPVAILDRTQKLSASAHIHKTAKKLHLYHGKHQEEQLDLNAILDDLGRMGYHDVWVEAGAALFNALHQQNLVQRTYVYLVPKILGTEAMSLYTQEKYTHENNLAKAKHITWEAMGDNLKITLDWQASAQDNFIEESTCSQD